MPEDSGESVALSWNFPEFLVPLPGSYSLHPVFQKVLEVEGLLSQPS